MKKLPIGIQTFADIRDKNENYVYIDKTKIALDLIKNGRYYFLSRPRRFGKSLFLDTLRAIFAGEKELFDGLYIYDKYNFNSYPVIYISFGGGLLQSRDELNEKFEEVLEDNESNLNVKCHNQIYNRRCFNDLIKKSYEKYNQKVVILIDEYDKPILDNIEKKEVAQQIRDGLKNFYSVIKDNDKYIKFVFLTGVSKFSKVSLFSGLNNLEDITIDKNYSTICGYTENDIEKSFAEHLKGVDLEMIKRWYNGYNWLGESVYNPFDILLFISKGREFRNYWFETGNPSFLIKLIKNKNYFIPNMEDIEIEEALLSSFDVDFIELETLLFQTGYLTIKSREVMGGLEIYRLTYPNLEVRVSLNSHILRYLANQSVETTRNRVNLYKTLLANDLNKLRDIFYSFFASIPNDWYRKNLLANYEGYYASIFYCYFSALGFDVIVEDSTNLGRIDLTIKFEERIYIFEFKVIEIDKSENSAIKQIKDKKYYEKYMNFKEVYLIGVEFSKDEKNIKAYEWARCEK